MSKIGEAVPDSTKPESRAIVIKPLSLIAVYVLFLSLSSAIAYLVSLSIQEELSNSVRLHLKKEALINEQLHAIHTRHLLIRDILLEEDPFAKDELILTHSEYARKVLKARADFESLPLDPEERALIDKQWRDSQTGYNIQGDFIEQSMDAEHDIRMQLYAELVGETQAEFLRRMNEMSSYRSELNTLSEDILSKAEQKQKRNWFLLMVFYILALSLGGIVIGWLYIKLRQRQIDLHWHSTHDNTTGLLNRQTFENQLQQLLDDESHANTSHSLLYIDLDQFKHINDSCGHAAGDALLKKLSKVLLKHTGPDDIVARLGGDEFGILLINTSVNNAKHQADQLRTNIYNLAFRWDERNFNTSISIGLVAIDPSEKNTQNILKHADIACFHAKDMGGNRIHTFILDDRTSTSKIHELDRVSQIKKALSDDRFSLYQQNVVSTKDGRTEFVEVLIRLRDEDNNVLSPAHFIPIAERYQLMGEIDLWVLRNTCQFILEHTQTDLRFSINLSGATLNNREAFDRLYSEIRESGVDASRLIFEITETSAISNLDIALKFIRDAKALGCQFALDDFGSGLCSFSYLKQIPVDYLKIDGSFIHKLQPDTLDYAVVQSIQSIAKKMSIQTVAEWVEDQAVLDHIKALSIDYAQGFYLTPPKPLT